MKRAVSLFLVLLLGYGCATTAPEPATTTDVGLLDHGAYPENYEELVKAYFAETLTDLDSVDYRIGKPVKGYLQHGPLFGGKVFLDGYFVDVWVKGKAEGAQEQHVGVVIKNGIALMQLTDVDMQRVKRVE